MTDRQTVSTADYEKLKREVEDLEKRLKKSHRMFYLMMFLALFNMVMYAIK